MKIKITTDSTADVNKEFFDKWDIGYLPEIVNMGGEEYYDTINIKNDDIYKYIKETKKLPKSAARSVEDFKEFFNGFLDNGYDAVIFVSISTHLSCIYKNALTASEEIGKNKVFVVDGRALSSGTMLLAMSAKELADAGRSAKEIAEIITHRAFTGQTSFVVDTLDNLYKGGRCSMLAMFGANLLKLKPKLQLVDGKIVPQEKYRGKSSVVLKKYIDDTLALYNNPDKKRCFLTHSDLEPQVLNEIVEYVKSKNIFEEIYTSTANCVVCTHCGKGTLGILYINDGGNF